MSFWISVNKQNTYLNRNCAAHLPDNVGIMSISFFILDCRNSIKKSTNDIDVTLDLSLIYHFSLTGRISSEITKISTLNLILIPIDIIFAKIKIY